MPLPELQERRTTSDQIADALRDAILTGEFSDGEELNQVALAKHFGVSRVPLREALRQLQAEGLVSAKAHQRTVVTGLAVDRVAEILELRSLLERHLLERAIEHIDAAEIERLDALCDEMDRIKDHQAWLAKNREFHQTLYSAAAAPFTTDLVEGLAKRVERYLHLWSDDGVKRNMEANREHRGIVEAVKSGDGRRASQELERHIARTRERVLDLFAERATTDPVGDGEADSA